MGNNNNNSCGCYHKENKHEEKSYKVKCHNHEFEASTDFERDDEGRIHNHRIAGVTGPAIKCGKTHVHKVNEVTDTFDDHFHGICETTGPAIYLPSGKHFHVISGSTTVSDGHKHDFYFITQVEDVTNVPEDDKC